MLDQDKLVYILPDPFSRAGLDPHETTIRKRNITSYENLFNNTKIFSLHLILSPNESHGS